MRHARGRDGASRIGLAGRGWAILVGLLVGLAFPQAAAADTLDEIRKSGHLRWGADQEGGGPYVFPREDDPSQVMGFEVDLAAKLAGALAVKSTFTQGQWDKLPDMLRTGKVDVVLNGYELTPERLTTMRATIPYYVYGLQLLVRKGDSRITSWADLAKKPGGKALRIGVLTGSSAEAAVARACGASCTVVSYDGNTDAMREVETSKLDATVQDTPIATFYAPRFPALAAVGKPTEKGYYVVYVAKSEPALLAALNQAIVHLVATGEIQRIDRRYGIWDEQQAELATIVEAGQFEGAALSPVSKEPKESKASTESKEPERAPSVEPVVSAGAGKHGLAIVRSYAGILVSSAGLTVALSVLSFPIAIALGILIAVGRLYGPRWVRVPLAGYVELIRGTPLMLQLYFIFFMLPEVGITLPAFSTGVLGLAINYSAYEAEIYRAGLQAVPPGQMEAALSLGMSRSLAIRRILIPQAVRIVIPPVVNDFIALFKDTSVCSVITLVELTKRFSVLSMSTQATVELMAMTATLYLAMSVPMSLLARHLERRLGAEAHV